MSHPNDINLNTFEKMNSMKNMFGNSIIEILKPSIKTHQNESVIKMLEIAKDKPDTYMELLAVAIFHKNFEIIKLMVEKFKITENDSPFMNAISFYNSILPENSELKSNEAKENYNIIQCPFVIMSGIGGDIEIYKYLIKNKLISNKDEIGIIGLTKKLKNSFYSNIIGACCYYGRTELLDYILKNDKFDLNIPTKEKKSKTTVKFFKEYTGLTPAMLAIVSNISDENTVNILKILNNHNAKFKGCDAFKDNLLHLAVKNNKINTVKYLIDELNLIFLMDEKNKDEYTPISLAQHLSNESNEIFINYFSEKQNIDEKQIEKNVTELLNESNMIKNKNSNNNKKKKKKKNEDNIPLFNSTEYEETLKEVDTTKTTKNKKKIKNEKNYINEDDNEEEYNNNYKEQSKINKKNKKNNENNNFTSHNSEKLRALFDTMNKPKKKKEKKEIIIKEEKKEIKEEKKEEKKEIQVKEEEKEIKNNNNIIQKEEEEEGYIIGLGSKNKKNKKSKKIKNDDIKEKEKEEEELKKIEQEKIKIQMEEEEKKKKIEEEEEKKRKLLEEEEQRKREEEEKEKEKERIKKLKEEEELKRRQREEELKRKQKEEEERKRREEEEIKRKEEERKQKEIKENQEKEKNNSDENEEEEEEDDYSSEKNFLSEDPKEKEKEEPKNITKEEYDNLNRKYIELERRISILEKEREEMSSLIRSLYLKNKSNNNIPLSANKEENINDLMNLANEEIKNKNDIIHNLEGKVQKLDLNNVNEFSKDKLKEYKEFYMKNLKIINDALKQY